MIEVESIEPWYKQFWPWFIILLPASVVVAGIITVVIAIRNEDSLVSNNYYKNGLAINRQLGLEKKAAELNVAASLRYEYYSGEIRIGIKGNFHTTPDSLRLFFSHPTDQHQDFTVLLKKTPLNDYLGQLEEPINGRWYLQLSDNLREHWQLNTEISVKKDLQVDMNYLETLK